MRYLRLVLIFLLVLGSKTFLERETVINLETHSKMYRDFEIILSDAIKTAVPSAQNISYSYIRSRVDSKNEITILFSSDFYETSNANVKIILEGEAKLSRIFELEEPTNRWSLDSFQLGDEEIAFQDEIVIEVDRSKLK